MSTLLKGKSAVVNQVVELGVVKETVGQRKKHVSMMSKAELNYLSNRVRILSNKWELTSHFLKNNRVVKDEFIHALLKDASKDLIVEYNEKTTKYGVNKRVLLRSSFAVPVLLEIKGIQDFVFANLCVVVDIKTGDVVTAYWNRVSDNHQTIQLSRYDETLRVF